MNLRNTKYITWLVVIIVCVSSCSRSEDTAKVEDRLLAQVHNKSLYASELAEMFPTGATREDSSQLINSVVESWVRENLLMHEAERNIPKDLNIDELVMDYRASLVKHSFEKRLVEVMLDSTITQAELEAYYEQNKEQYQLPSTILRCHFIKVPRPVEDLSKLQSLLNSDSEEDYKSLLEYCSNHAEVYMLEDSTWYKISDLQSQLPKGTISDRIIRKQEEFSLKDDKYFYSLKILERVSNKEIAPFSYIEDQASKVILHKRKISLLEKTKSDIYERELQKNNIKIYTE